MRRRPSLVVVLFSLVLLIAAARYASAQDIFVTPIPKAPFSVVVNVERSVVRNDGSIDNLKTIREIARDSRGRIYNEMRSLVPVTSTQTSEVMRIHLYDPQARVSTMIDPREQIFWTQTVSHPPSTVPPDRRYASPAGEGLQNEFAKEDDLGIRQMAGVSVHEVRETQTLPADGSGVGKEIVTTDECWYSDDLRINLVIKHSDPRTGTVTMTVAQVSRTEPDPSLFEIPAGYKPAGAANQ